MKRWLSVICMLLSMMMLQAELVYVALLGSPAQLVDLLQAELSESKELALLERREINKIMQERKLAELSWETLSKEFPHTDVFVVLSENGKGKSGRVLSFNAKNGARLMDMNWHGNPYEHVIQMAGDVQSAAVKPTMEGVRYLAMTEARFVNVMNPIKGKCMEWRQLFEQNLLRQNDIQLMERERLDKVLAERRLTEESHELSSSAHLVGIEFEGRGRADEIHCKVICMDVTGKKQFAVEAKDILTASEKTAAELAVQFNQALAKAVIDMAAEGKDRKAEAAKFFKMYNTYTMSKYSSGVRKNPWALAAAVALDPDNPVYRYQELVVYNLGPYPENEQWLEKANSVWELAFQFRRDFPDIHVDYLPHLTIWRMASAVGELRTKIQWHKERGDEEIVKELSRNLVDLDRFYRKYKPYVMEDFLRQGERVVFKDDRVNPTGFTKSLSDAVFPLVNLYYRYGFYVDEKERMNDYLQALNSWLKPENAEKRICGNKVDLFPLPWEALTSAACQEDFLKFAEENKLVEKLMAYQANIQKNTGKELQEGFLLDFFIKAIAAEKPEDAKALARQFLTNVRKNSPSFFKDGSHDYERYYLTSSPFIAVARKHGLSEDFVLECLKNEMPISSKNKKPTDVENVIQEVTSSHGSDESMKKLMPYVPQIKQDVMKYMTDQGYYNLLVWMAQTIWETGRVVSVREQVQPSGVVQKIYINDPNDLHTLLRPLQEEFFKAVNENAHLTYGRYADLLETTGNIGLHQACRDGDNILLLLERIGSRPFQTKPNSMFIASLHPDLTVDIILDSVVDLSDRNSGPEYPRRAPHLGGIRNGCQLACNPSFIVFGYESSLWVLDRKANAIVSKIQIPETRDFEIAVTNERLYILSYTSLISMNLQGEDRQVIFDMERLDVQSELDRKGRATGLQLLPDGRLMFLGSSLQQSKSSPKEKNIMQIWTCNADGSELKSCIQLPFGRFYGIYDGGEGPLLSSYSKHDNCVVYRINVDKKELTMIAQTPKTIFNHYRLPFTSPYSSYPYIDQFIVKNGWLFQGHFYPLCVNISAPEKSPFFWLPFTYKMLSIGNHVMFMRNNSWFLVDTKQEGE